MVLAPQILTGLFGASMGFGVLFFLWLFTFRVFVYLFDFPVMTVEPRTSCMLGKHIVTKFHPRELYVRPLNEWKFGRKFKALLKDSCVLIQEEAQSKPQESLSEVEKIPFETFSGPGHSCHLLTLSQESFPSHALVRVAKMEVLMKHYYSPYFVCKQPQVRLLGKPSPTTQHTHMPPGFFGFVLFFSRTESTWLGSHMCPTKFSVDFCSRAVTSLESHSLPGISRLPLKWGGYL